MCSFSARPGKFRNEYGPDAFGGLRRRNHIPVAYTLEGFVDGQGTVLKINVPIFQGKQFPGTQPGIIQGKESGPCLHAGI